MEYGEVDTTIVDRFIQLDCTAQIRDICDAIIRGDTTNLGAVAPILDKFTSEIGSAGKSDEDLIVTSNIRSILDDLVSSDVLFNSGLALAFSGKPEKAIPLLEKAIRLNPFAPSIYFMTMNASYRMAGRFDEAVEQAKKAVERNPKDLYAYLALVGGCMLTGRETEARAAAAEVLKIKPAFSVEEAEKTLPYKDKSFVDRSVDAWRKAGLK